MVDSLWRTLGLHEGHRVMAWIAMQESKAKLPAGKADLGKIRYAEPEQVPVKPKRFVQARGKKDHVPQAHLTGLESRNGAARMKRPRVDRAPAENLRAHSAWIYAVE